jgi:uncharacterized protein YigA (DUF484 family)
MTSHARGIKQDAINDGSVTRYLETYPDFFERNAALLAKLRLPHLRESSATVSLVERQVEVLRDRNQALERKLAEFKDVARANEALANRIHSLSQRLIRGRTLLDTIHAVETSLREDFDAHNSVLLLFMEQARDLEAEAGRFLKTADPADDVVKSLESLLQSGKPRCGQIRDAQREFLFGKDGEIGSVALAPLGAGGALGLLAIAASDADRFHPAVSTEFLTRIGELLANALTR